MSISKVENSKNLKTEHFVDCKIQRIPKILNILKIPKDSEGSGDSKDSENPSDSKNFKDSEDYKDSKNSRVIPRFQGFYMF